MKAVIMAGGFGTRLRPLTCKTPKPMVPLMNRPMMYHIVSLLKKHGMTDIIASLFYKPEVITAYFGDGSPFGVNVTYFRSEADFGTAGSVRLATEGTNERVLVISGDVLTDFDLTAAIRFHEEKQARATLVLTHATNPLQFGVVITQDNGKITRFLEKPSWGEVFSDTINTGIYILEPEALALVPLHQEFDFSKDLFPLLLRQNAELYGCIVDGYWRDIGNLKEYQDAHIDALQGKVRVEIGGPPQGSLYVGEGSRIPPGLNVMGTVVIGSNCTIGEGVMLSNSVIGDDCVIGTRTSIAQSVLWNNVVIGQNAELSSDVVGNGSSVGDNAQVSDNVYIGDGCWIGRGARLTHNIKLWPDKVVEAGAVLTRSLVLEDKWLRELFTDSRVTGTSNIEMNPEFGARLGAAYGAFIGPDKTVVTSRDSDNVSRMINRALICGLISSGVNTFDLRATAIPILRHELSTGKEAGGIHVRRSPLNKGSTDIIFFDANGKDLPSKKTKAVERFFFGEDFARAPQEKVGSISFPERTTEAYKERFLSSLNIEMINTQKFRLAIDYSNGVAATIFPVILGSFDCQVVAINAHLDPRRLTRSDYETEMSIRQLSHIVTSLKYDLGIMIDAGAERISVVGDNGEAIDNGRLLTLVTELFLQTHPDTASIAVPIISSGEIDLIAASHGVTPLKTRDSHLAMMEAASNKSTRFVGGTKGGFIFPDFFFATDAMYSVAKILELLATTKKTLGMIDREVPRLQRTHRKVNCSWEYKGKVMRKIMRATEGMRRDLVDGVRVYPGPSSAGLSALLIPDKVGEHFNIFTEAPDAKAAEDLAAEYQQKIEQWLIEP